MPSVRLVQFMLFLDKVIHRLTPMLPTGKRAADDAWAQGDRVRATICTQTEALPALPADCWGVVMEFVMERRAATSFGAHGTVVEPSEWLPRRNYDLTKQIRCLRLVSRTWNRLASALVRAIVIDQTNQDLVRHIPAPAATFPNVRYIQAYDVNIDYSPFITAVDTWEKNAERLHGHPPPPGYSRICDRRTSGVCLSPPRLVGKSDTIFQYVPNNALLAKALTTVDVIFMGYMFETGDWPAFATPFPLRASVIIIPSSIDDFLFTLLAASDEKARKNVRIFTDTMPLAHFVWKRCAPLGIQQFPPVSEVTNTDLFVGEDINRFIGDCFMLISC